MQTGTVEAAETQTIGGFSDVLAELSAPLDPRLIKQREGFRDRNGNVQYLDYVEWFVVADILDAVAPEWSHEIKSIREIGDMAVVIVALTIDGVTREGLGTGNIHNETGLKKAEHDALKRAAVKFGIARDLYRKEGDDFEYGQDRSDNGSYPSQPVARNLGELVSAKQLGMIRALARELRIDADEECNSVMSCRTDELSKSAASSFIKHLQEMQRPSEPQQVNMPLERQPARREEPHYEPDPPQRGNGGGRQFAPASKPLVGGFESRSDEASVKQLGVLSKIAVERGETIEDIIREEFDDIQGASQLSKKAASYLIETYKTW